MQRLDEIFANLLAEIQQINDMRRGLASAAAIPTPDKIAQIVVSLKLGSTDQDGTHVSSLDLVAAKTDEILALIAQGVQQDVDLKRADILTRLNMIIALADQAKDEWLNPTPAPTPQPESEPEPEQP